MRLTKQEIVPVRFCILQHVLLVAVLSPPRKTAITLGIAS